ncbi:MAG: hypothetical protein GF393_09170 [Armatimonadia bacterium]|nr:hypothetical protein [Armatimonadia bacterium]
MTMRWCTTAVLLAAMAAACICGCERSPAQRGDAVEEAPADLQIDTEPVRLGSVDDVAPGLIQPLIPETDGSEAFDAPSVIVTTRGGHLMYESSRFAGMSVDGEDWPGETVMLSMGGLDVSEDGEHIAYGCSEGVVLDGQVIAEEQQALSVVLSPDGERVAWTEFLEDDNDPGEQVVINGEPVVEGIGPYDMMLSARFSPDGSRFAFVGRRGIYSTGKQMMVHDGEVSEEYDRILFSGPIFSPDSEHLAWAAVDGGRVKVILDGEVVHDYPAEGVESDYASCMTAPMMLMSTPMAFSEDSKRFAFYDQSPDGQAVVFDGERSEEWEMVGRFTHWPVLALAYPLEAPAFHPDGHSVAYFGLRDGAFYAVSEGSTELEYEVAREDDRTHVTGGPWWTTDGEHLVTVVADPERMEPPAASSQTEPVEPDLSVSIQFPERLVVDGEVRAKTDGIIAGPYFGPGDSIVLSARRDDGMVCIIDGEESATWDVVGMEPSEDMRWAGPVLSPDGTRVAHAAMRDGTWRMVVDGEEGPEFENIIGLVHRWAPVETEAVTYVRPPDASDWVETEDMTGAMTALSGGEPVWSPDGEMVAYAGRDDDGWHLVAGEHVGDPCESIFPETIRWLHPGVVEYVAVRDDAFWRLTADLR